MDISLNNTMTGKKEVFRPITPGKVGLYVCGPTVYDMSHIGHARVYVTFDVVARFLRSLGNDVTYVRNFTDIDDKIIRRANEQGVSASEISEKFIAEFQKDMASLGVDPADVEPKVTEHIPEIIALIEKIMANGYAYESGGDVYFSVRSFPGYGKLSKRDLDQLEAGARVEVGDKKRDPLDFALWKAAKPGEPFWESPWGKGRPGWHIECSAMSAKYLGETFDIHAGGKDLVFPHHENEIAQSEAASGKAFANFWMHNGFVQIDNEKMSKSLGNFFTIRDVLKTYEAESLRMFLLGTHYRNPINFSDAALSDAERRLDYLYETLAKVNERLSASAKTEGSILEEAAVKAIVPDFQKAMCDDFNAAEALGQLSAPFALMNQLCEKPRGKKGQEADRTLRAILAELDKVCAVLGILREESNAYLLRRRARKAAERGINPEVVEAKIQERQEARQAKDFARADAIRGELKEMGVELMDTPTGTGWKVI